MKNSLNIISIIFSVLSGCFCFYYFQKAERLTSEFYAASTKVDMIYLENDLIIENLNTLNVNIKFVEQSIPEIQKRNAKAKIVKEIVEREIKYTKQNHFKSEREFNDYILSVVDYSDKYRVPTSMILAVSRTESNFNPRAVSPTNAQGIMQLIPSTTKFCVSSLKKDQHDPFYVRDSVQCGAWYLREMLNTFKEEEKVIAAYNAGPTYVLKFDGKDLPLETIDYQEKVFGFMSDYKPQLRWEH